MRRLALTLVLAAIVGGLIGWLMPGEAAPPPIQAGQPHPDQFTDPTYGNLAQYSTLYPKAKAQRTVRYRLVTESGCSAGTIPQDMGRVEQEMASKVGFALVRDTVTFDFTVHINCGSEQIRICGSVNIFCLGRGFPYNNDVDLSDILSTYQPATRLSIPLHEIAGHAIQVASEQYCFGTGDTAPVCQGLPQFTPAPNWPDFMNTGELSRHGFEAIECGRWLRVMYEDAPCAQVYFPAPVECAWLGYDPCSQTTIYLSGWRQTRADEWIDPNGVVEFTSCNADRLRWSPPIARWVTQGSGFFDPATNVWALTPGC